MNMSADSMRQSIAELGLEVRELGAGECAEIRRQIVAKFCKGPMSWMYFNDLRTDNPSRPVVRKEMSDDPIQAGKFIPEGRTIVLTHEYQPDAMWEFESARDAAAAMMNSVVQNVYATNRATSFL